jgi:acetylornithine deacetylase/succinyl-diaminopimelate desuccinylase-like protein
MMNEEKLADSSHSSTHRLIRDEEGDVSAIEWDAVQTETASTLSEFIRFDTSNPPGNETPLAEHIAGILRGAGYDPQILEYAPGRGNVVARYGGRGEKPPLLLMGHLDVVPVEPEYWTHLPFGGDMADGYVWGRGAVDMKGMVAMEVMVMQLLARHRPNLARDVIFAGTADEEMGGDGIRFLAEEHPDLIRAEYALNEFGGVTQWIGGVPVYPIQVAEKGICWLRVRAHGQPGHASIPHADNAVVRLARAIRRLDRRGLPHHLTAPVRDFAREVSRGQPGLARLLMPLMFRPGIGAFLRRLFLSGDAAPAVTAMLCNTATPTGLSAGLKTNVIPSEAEATIDGRTLPGFDAKSLVAELRAVMGDDLEYEVFLEAPPLEFPYDTPLFRLMADKLRQLHPGACPVPMMAVGVTDAKQVTPLGITVYGFSPMRITAGENLLEWIHGHNERVPVDALGFGVRALYEVVVEFCAGG